MSGCSGNCSSCSSNCDSRKEAQDMRIPSGPFSNVKKVIGVVSGKGGVGKSLVTSMLASAMQARGNACAVLDIGSEKAEQLQDVYFQLCYTDYDSDMILIL